MIGAGSTARRKAGATLGASLTSTVILTVTLTSILGLAVPLLGGAGCASTGPAGGNTTGNPGAPPAIDDPPRRPGRPLVLVAMPDSAPFHAVRGALIKEVMKDFDVLTQIVDARTTSSDFRARIEASRPACVVLMDNPTIRLYREYQNVHRPPAPMPPAVVVMSSFLEELRAQLPNVTGVAYEVPGVTAFVNLRSVMARPLNRVGVIHRPAFRRFVERQKALAAKEQVELVPLEVAADPTPANVRHALRQLRTEGRVDALWVLNDNALLRDAAFLETAWRQELAALQVPVIVGVPTLVSAEARFGNFAVLPDLAGLGVQTANVLFELADAGWRAEDLAVELPLSTITVVKVEEVRQNWGLREGAAQRIDRVIE